MPKLHKVKETPEWFRLAGPLSKFFAADTARLFGFSNYKSLWSSVQNGCFPKPDGRCLVKGMGAPQHQKHLWSKALLLEEIKRRNKTHDK